MLTSQTSVGASSHQVRFYIDQNCSPQLAGLLKQLGYRATTAAEQGRSRRLDNDQLLFAAQQFAVLITRDREDFRALHYAWLTWPREWNVNPHPKHAGVLVVPAQWTVQQTVREVDRFVRSGPVLVNSLYIWEDHPALSDWIRQPDPL